MNQSPAHLRIPESNTHIAAWSLDFGDWLLPGATSAEWLGLLWN